MTRGLLSPATPARPIDGPVTLCAVVRDEMFLLEAFFAHYRALGLRAFHVLDDGSTDGSREFLRAQPDCTLFVSDHSFGDRVDGMRVDVLWKQALVAQLPPDAWGLSVDADEFLALADAAELEALVADLEARGARAALAAMIDLYPATPAQIRDAAIRRLDPGADWYFDAGPYVAHGPEGAEPIVLGDGVKGRLTRRFGLAETPAAPSWRRLLRGIRGKAAPAGPAFGYKVYKTPLLRNGPGLRFHNSHWATPGPLGPGILPLAHYKFTADLQAKIDWALATRVHAMGSRAYEVYDRILKRLEAEGGSFLFEGSRPARSPADFYAAGSATRAAARTPA